MVRAQTRRRTDRRTPPARVAALAPRRAYPASDLSSELQRGVGLVVPRRVSRDAHDGEEPGNSGERLGHQPRELRVPVRHVAAARHQSRDDAAQRQERLVDLAGFPRALVHGARPGDVLGPREVDEVELAAPDDVLAVGGGLLGVHGDAKDGVRSAGLLVHQRLRGATFRASPPDVVEDLLGVGHRDLLQPLHRDAAFSVLHQRMLRGFGVGSLDGALDEVRHGQQIGDLFVVELQERALDAVLHAFGLQVREYVRHGPRDDARVAGHRIGERVRRCVVPVVVTLHRVRLARARLSVREDRAVVTREHVIAHVRGAGAEDGLLAGVQQDVVEAELDGVRGVVDVARAPRFVRLLDLDGDGLAVGL
mmetsp:Transcript_10063/g.45594  ORF Transcript_10063/g.45594 Transcript_10063/m.45594 type:complete len:365 (-) Transcript_10063:118-1212(-)